MWQYPYAWARIRAHVCHVRARLASRRVSSQVAQRDVTSRDKNPIMIIGLVTILIIMLTINDINHVNLYYYYYVH